MGSVGMSNVLSEEKKQQVIAWDVSDGRCGASSRLLVRIERRQPVT
jgi:hypothetical protein